MAINVILGEVKTHEQKPFPKLMIHKDGTITRFKRNGVGVHIYAPPKLDYIMIFKEIEEINMMSYTDYNEPITLQNA